MDSLDDIGSSFTQVNQQSDVSESVKTLFDNDKELKRIFQITDLSENQVSLITRIWMIGEMKDVKQFKELVLFFCQVQLSKNRRSRDEVLRAIQGYQENRSWWSNTSMNPSNWGGGRGR